MKVVFGDIYINIKIYILVLCSLSITSCAIYKSSFNCGDAEGARCISMDKVDSMIDSGEIEKYYKSKIYPNRTCLDDLSNDWFPKIKQYQKNQYGIYEIEEVCDVGN
ncbi:MAG: hypothetical protein DGJ47_000895 [Rickettsiaceae bacterium]